MANKFFGSPFILLLSDMGDDTFTGGASGQGNTDPDADVTLPWSYQEWLNANFEPDDPDYGLNWWEDYYYWWVDAGFGEAAWYEANPGVTFPPPMP